MSISLKKGQKISLTKSSSSGGLGEILVNLNWNSQGIDLDLGCLYELKNGRKHVVQALGNAFGSFDTSPYIVLDGDDRTGASADGENLRINGAKVSEIKRVLVYTFIYEGAANWREANAVVTIKYPNAEDIIVDMDEYADREKMCGLVLFENIDDATFSVERLIRFYKSHHDLDAAFNWGLKWVKGKKD